MYDYNASYLNEQKTLLEEFHKIQRYLIEHPLYQIYQSSADYVAGVNEYYINEVTVREGGALSVGDVVLFSNVYYGVITEINEETEMFTIAEGISFRGATGETGPRGATGETGPRGLPGADGTNGTNGTDGKNGLSIYLYDGALNDTLTTAYVAQINVPTGYTVKTGDILFSTLETSYGAMSLVTSDAVDFSTVVSIDYIGRLAGASGGKVIRDIDGNIPASALENISVSVGTASNGVTYIRASMKGEVTYDDNTYDTINYYIDLPIKAGDGVTIEAQPLEGGTGNKQLVISASGGGGGVSDVQINGASIVRDGVANIPYASAAQAGVVSTGDQRFYGQKIFDNLRVGVSVSKSQRIYYSETPAGDDYIAIPNLAIGISADSRPYTRHTSTSIFWSTQYPTEPSLTFVGYYPAGTGTNKYHNVRLYLPHEGVASANEYPEKTIMATPKTWSTGTSGSVTLPSAGLYEVKATIFLGLLHTTLYWDGSAGTLASFGGISGVPAIAVSSTGVITTIDPTDLTTPIELTLEYRKIGIA